MKVNHIIWLLQLLRSGLFIGLLIYSAAATYLFFFADGMIFFPPEATYAHLPQQDPTAINLTDKSGHQLAARYLPNPNSRYTLLFSHGNASDIGSIHPIALALYDAGFSVLTYDYPGYGHSSGKPTEGGTYSAITAAYDYLTDEQNIPPSQIIVQGQSVGSGPATYLAAQRPVAGLILESPFATVFQVVVPFRILPFEKFPNIKRVGDIDCPLLLIHGTEDQTIPFSHSEELLAAAQSPKQLVPILGAGHNDILLLAKETYLKRIQDFAAGL